VPDHQVTEDVFGQIEVALEGPDLIRLETEVGYGVEAFAEAADGIREAAPPPLVYVFDLAAPLLDEVAHAFDGRGEALIARFGADDHNQFVVSHLLLAGLKLKARAATVNGPPSPGIGIIAHGEEIGVWRQEQGTVYEGGDAGPRELDRLNSFGKKGISSTDRRKR